MENPDEAMDSLTVYTPELRPITQEDMDEISAMFMFLCEEEKAA